MLLPLLMKCRPDHALVEARNDGRSGVGRAVPADTAECRLWVQKGDDRRNAPQRARCSESGLSSTASEATAYNSIL